MKVAPADADRMVASPPKGMVAALLFGPDLGLVRERSEILLKTVLPDLSDPFRFADLDEAALLSNPTRLADEAAQLSMLGGRRVLRVRGAGNGVAKIFQAFLQDPKGEALVVAEAGDLPKASALRKLFEDAKNAAAVACYGDSPRNLAQVVREHLRSVGLSIAPDALEDAVSRLGSDRAVTRRELDKLALYAHGQTQVSREDVRAAMGDEAEVRIEEACDGAGLGDTARLDLALERLWASEVSPVAVARQTMSHMQRLLIARERMDKGEGLDSIVRSFRPPLHFSRVDGFKAQVSLWRSAALHRALALLYEGEVLAKTSAVPSNAALGQILFQVAMLAKAGRR